MKNSYQKTIRACFVAYIVQAIVNNFAPLLFLTFQRSYQIPLERITLLVTINFGVQLLVDLLSVGFVDRIGYRTAMVLAHALSTLGLILLTILPALCRDPFGGILCAVVAYAIGGGLLEVVVSPVVEACPSDNKEKAMSMLHSFYCWGHVGVVLLSTLFFSLIGITHWKLLALLWALIPLCNLFVFLKVPIPLLISEGETGMRLSELLRTRLFWIFLIMMICAGASEQAVSQWASTFAEKGLGVSKTIGDLAGPMAFAVLMGECQSFLRSVWRPHRSGSFYARKQSAVYYGIPLHLAFADTRNQPDWLCSLWPVSRYHVAWKLQQGIGSHSEGRHSDVCAAGTWRGCRLLRRSDPGRSGIERNGG